MDTSQYLILYKPGASCALKQRSHLEPGHGAQVRYSLGTNVKNVNTLYPR